LSRLGFPKNKKPFEQLDLRGSDLELGTISRLQHSPDTSGVELFLRPKADRVRARNNEC